jgi:molybdopterin/thiamine biosynthesis adenylyltransferase
MDIRLSTQERERYRRQMMLGGFAEEHQQRLKDSTAFIAGIGGLGGTAALYLAVAGIGRLVLVHAGNLTLSNMNRQVLMRHDRIGTSRVVQAEKTLREINPDVEIEVHDERVTETQVDRLLAGAQIALSARPNYHERRALNAVCVHRQVPMVEAAMNGMEGYHPTSFPGNALPLLSLSRMTLRGGNGVSGQGRDLRHARLHHGPGSDQAVDRLREAAAVEDAYLQRT